MSSESDASQDISEDELYLEELGRAVEAKATELGQDVHPDLGPIVLTYADALLTREENNLDPLANNPDEEDGDLQVAWECFEQARLCFEAAEEPSDQLSFVHQRLGDLTSLQGNFEVAIDEYQAALKLLRNDGARVRAGILVPLGQSLMMVQRFAEAKEAYQQACDLLLTLVDAGEGLHASIEEIKQCVIDCETAVGQVKPVEEKPKENAFDLPTLDPGKEVVVAQVRRKNEPEVKRKRT